MMGMFRGKRSGKDGLYTDGLETIISLKFLEYYVLIVI